MATTGKKAASDHIALLRDFRTRRDAISALVDMGKPAVNPLIELLDSSDPAMSWCAARALGGLGADGATAVEALTAKLDEPNLRSVAAAAIHRLTGSDPLAAELMPLSDTHRDNSSRFTEAELLRGCATLLDATPEDTPDGQKFEIDAAATAATTDAEAAGEAGATQTVFVSFVITDDQAIVRIVSPTGVAAAPEAYENLLKDNAGMLHGAYGLQDIDGRSQFILTATHRRAAIDPRALAYSVRDIAVLALETLERLAPLASTP